MRSAKSINQGIRKAMVEGERVAKKYNPDTLISFPFENIFEEEGISLSFFPDKKKFDNMSGVIYFSKGGDTKISVKEGDSRYRQYFTIAHELGHYFLHKDDLRKRGGVFDLGNVLMMYRTDIGLSSEKEREANYFAGSLLMPKKRVREAWERFEDIEKCAKLFSVSKSAMAVRLNVLNLID